jgi:hypothetical protein
MNDADIVDYQQGEGSISRPHSQELGDASVRKLAATVLDSILRWSSQPFCTGIRVSPMSTAWLQMHEGEYCKHRVEV